MYLIEFFDPSKFLHLDWYGFHRANGYWPQSMLDVLAREGVTLMPMDPINVAIKIADHYLHKHEAMKLSQAAMFAGKKPGER